VALAAIQVTLGALTVLTARSEWINSLHVVCGALVLATSLVLTLRSWRLRFAFDRITAGARLDSGALGSSRVTPRTTSPSGVRA
jgi:cytochrome c oxidase assembly protein subunit 15